ncbi:MAG: EamA family transporter, partial [Tardiphaga sp.]|nr:EamA family transporter [Tardiphaga sp.]
NSAIMNVEPVFALVLAWLILGQTIATIQVIGALIVVGAVMALGMRKRTSLLPPIPPPKQA